MRLPDAAGFWESRYAERDQIWSGEPNRALVGAAGDLPPGQALDLGCGEGGDSLWLAGRGWQVSAVDVSATAIARAQALAVRRGIPDGRITWLVEDLSGWQPAGHYDLVTACFLHSPVDFPRAQVLQRAGSAVAPGGHLLVVGHAGPPPWAAGGDHAHHRFLTPAEELADLQLDSARWEVIVSEIQPRAAVGPNGERANLDDTVLLVRRAV